MIYRKDIDGLRAIAVLPVILCHAGFSAFSGGFVGVDVFFVISGFLITGILLQDIENGRFSIVEFYHRRFRRILPALFVMLICVSLVAVAIMQPAQLLLFSRAITAVLLFWSNFFFWRNVDYFAASAGENPLVHTWSLAVEEQFYLAYPILLAGLFRLGMGRKGILTVIVLLSLASFAVSEWAWPRYPAPNFYLLPSRAWELGVGCVCAFLARSSKVQPSAGLALLGLAMILASVFLYSEETPFPSRYALLPVVGTAMVILFGQADDKTARTGLAARVLCWQPLVFVGLISYSAYLWHQPIMAFARIRSVTGMSFVTMMILSCLSLVLGYLSWRFVERPFRRPTKRLLPSRASLFATSFAVAAVLFAAGWTIQSNDGFRQRWEEHHSQYPAVIEAIRYSNSDEKWQQFFGSGCFGIESRIEHCLRTSANGDNYLLIGDSFAAQYALALRRHYPQANLMQWTTSGCRPLWNGRGTQACQDHFRKLADYLESHKDKIDGVLVAARWQANEAPDLEVAVGRIKSLGIPVAVIGPSPEYSTDFPYILLRMLEGGSNAASNVISSHERFRVEAVLEPAVERAGGAFIPLMKAICRDVACPNYASNGNLMHFDYGHFTQAGAETVIAKVFPDDLAQLFE